MMDTNTHYIAGTNKITACNTTTETVHARNELISIFSADVNCPGCLSKIAEFAAMGFVPKH